MRRKKIIRYSILGVLGALIIGGILYKLPYHQELVYEDIPIWYADDMATRERLQRFGESSATIVVSYTTHRNFFAPPTYSGWIRVNDQESQITQTQSPSYDSFIESVYENIKMKILDRKEDVLVLNAQTLEYPEETRPFPQHTCLMMFRKMKSEDKFFLLETLQDGNYAGQLIAYVYPAENHEQAYELFENLY